MSFTHNNWISAAALTIGLVLLCNSTTESSRGQVDAQEFGRLAGYRDVEFVPSAEGSGAYLDSEEPLRRVKRQVTIPQQAGQYQQPAQQPQSGGIMSYLSDLGPQLQQASAISQLFSPSSQQPQQQPSIFGMGGVGSGSPTSTVDPAQLMTQLSNLIRATQQRTSRGVEAGQETAQSAMQAAGQQLQDANQSTQNAFQTSAQTAGQISNDAAKNAQSGIQSALKEIGSGLQRIASNNPNLIPDVKSLYQSVATKLSSASSSMGQAANQAPASPIST